MEQKMLAVTEIKVTCYACKVVSRLIVVFTLFDNAYKVSIFAYYIFFDFENSTKQPRLI